MLWHDNWDLFLALSISETWRFTLKLICADSISKQISYPQCMKWKCKQWWSINILISTTQKETSLLKIIHHKKKPLSSKSFHTKRNLSPQNLSTQKETSHLKIFPHKKKPLSSKSFHTKRNLSPQNHSAQKETSLLKIKIKSLYTHDRVSNRGSNHSIILSIESRFRIS